MEYTKLTHVGNLYVILFGRVMVLCWPIYGYIYILTDILLI